MTVVLDFDGVIHDYSAGYTGPTPEGKPIEGAKDMVLWLLDKGYKVVVCTARIRSPGRDTDLSAAREVRNWLIKHEFPLELAVVGHKPPGVLYVDDRGFRFEGPQSWQLVRAMLDSGDPGTWQHEKGEWYEVDGQVHWRGHDKK